MKMINERCRLAMLILLALVGMTGRTEAIVITVDEFGTGFGTVGGGFVSNLDTGPGSLPGVLTYVLPFAGRQGDVFLQGPDDEGISDVIRFDGNFHLFFYSATDTISDNQDVHDVGLPTGSYTNNIKISELGPEGSNSAVYRPGSSDPGFDANVSTYRIFSDGPATAPEPSSLVLFGLGAGCIALRVAYRHCLERFGTLRPRGATLVVRSDHGLINLRQRFRAAWQPRTSRERLLSTRREGGTGWSGAARLVQCHETGRGGVHIGNSG